MHRNDEHGVLILSDIGFNAPTALLARYGWCWSYPGRPTHPGSHWGDCEAGIIGNTVYARSDTPVHSLLHEAGHLIVLPPDHAPPYTPTPPIRYRKKDAVCVLQALLGEALGIDRIRIWADMDAWGYTFRLGSARAYTEHDADTAWQWLHTHGLTDAKRQLALPAA